VQGPLRENLVNMQRVIDQIRASRLPSGMMQFAARGALQVPPAENIEILVHLALHNKVFGELAKMTLAGWDEKACRTAAADPQTSKEVLDYFIARENLRPTLLPDLIENPSVPESELVKLAVSGLPETIEALLKSARVQYLESVFEALKANPHLKREQAQQIEQLTAIPADTPTEEVALTPDESGQNAGPSAAVEQSGAADEIGSPEDEETVSAYLEEHAREIAAEGNQPFQAIGGVVELLGADYFPVTRQADLATAATTNPSTSGAAAKAAAVRKPAKPDEGKRENALQKISNLDVKGRIQLALKGNKEERSLLIRDGTKVVALAVLEAPKLSDGEVEKFASQKNVLEAVLRQIPLKRRFMKNYIVVRNLVANPRTPLDLGLNLMKNLLTQDLKNLSANKEVSETIRKLALKMYKQKLEAANKK
jgi:hypothetical protein